MKKYLGLVIVLAVLVIGSLAYFTINKSPNPKSLPAEPASVIGATGNDYKVEINNVNPPENGCDAWCVNQNDHSDANPIGSKASTCDKYDTSSGSSQKKCIECGGQTSGATCTPGANSVAAYTTGSSTLASVNLRDALSKAISFKVSKVQSSGITLNSIKVGTNKVLSPLTPPPSCYLKITDGPLSINSSDGWQAASVGTTGFRFNSKNLSAVGCDLTVTIYPSAISFGWMGDLDNYWINNNADKLVPNAYMKNETTGQIIGKNVSLWDLYSTSPIIIKSGTTALIGVYSDITKVNPHYFNFYPNMNNYGVKDSVQNDVYVDYSGSGKNISFTYVNADPRISTWNSKVNQHFNISYDKWMTDPDGKSGANLDKLTYCKKWYPNTISVADYMMEKIDTWRGVGNLPPDYSSTRMSTKCVQDLTPRISYFSGKVNQHFNLGRDEWVTDPDGKSGANLDKLTYCKKWYPDTKSVVNYKTETITFQAAGNVGAYSHAGVSTKCVQ